MRYIYSLFLYLVAPLVPFYLKKRAKKNPDYDLFWSERFAFKLKNDINKPIIWLHAVSIGEMRAMNKLIELLNHNYPEYQILITQMTPTGRNTAKELYPQAKLHYLPYDLPHGVINFYKTFKPKIGLIMETEIWPNLIHYADKFNIPLFLVNARLSEKSFQAYNKVKWGLKPILNKLTAILCQNEVTLNNFKQLGYTKEMQVIGNTKFDNLLNNVNVHLIKQLKQGIMYKKVIIFASTRSGEEQQILDNLPLNSAYLVIIVPRHPERFKEVEQLIITKGLRYQKRLDIQTINPETQILLGNSMGEMALYYNLSDIAIIGGSFNNFGSQNLIEPVQLNVPVIFGPSTYNFPMISQNALNDGCAIQVQNIAQCFTAINQIINDDNKYQSMKQNCTTFIQRYQGASQKILDIIQEKLK